MHHLISIMAVTSVLACATAGVTAEIPKGFISKIISIDGKEMKYVVYVPSTCKPNTPMPTIVFLNGAGECGTDGLKQIAVGLAPAVMFNVDKWPFIIVFPQKQDVNHGWEDEDAMVMAILEKTEKEYKVDKSRLYLTGLSQGGHGTWTIAAKHPNLFAAIAPVCGWADEETAKKLVKIPSRVFHGDADKAVNVESGIQMEKWLKAGGADCTLTIYPGVGHNSWDKAYCEEGLYDWFLKYHK